MPTSGIINQVWSTAQAKAAWSPLGKGRQVAGLAERGGSHSGRLLVLSYVGEEEEMSGRESGVLVGKIEHSGGVCGIETVYA